MSDSVGSVSVDVVPDARGWSEKLRAQIRDQKVSVKADADTTEAETQLDEVARTRTAKIKTDVSQLSQGASMLDKFVGNLGLLPALAITAGSALIPLGATLVGITAALAAPLAIAGGGATLFALLGGAAVAQTQKQLKAITALQTKLAGLKKGTQEYADTAKELKAQQAALTPAQTAFASSLDKVKGAFAGLLAGKNGQALLGPIADGLTLLAQVLPKLQPLIGSVGGAISTLIGDLSHAASGPGFKIFIDQIARLAGRDIVIGGRIIGDLASGVGSLLTATDKGFSGGFLRGLERLTSSFADWASSKGARKGLSDFFDYVHRVGPQVGDTVGSIARAIGHIVHALAPLGPPVLHIIQGIADAISGIPLPVLTALAGAAAGLVAFQKLGGFKAASLLTGGLGGGGAGGILSGGVQKVYVVNMGAGGLGGGGKTGPLGTAAKFVLPAAILYGAYKIGQAKGNAEDAAFNKKYGVTTGFGVDGLKQYVQRQAAGKFQSDFADKKHLTIDMSPKAQEQLATLKALQAHGFNPMPSGPVSTHGKINPSQLLLRYGLDPQQARGLANIPQIKSTGTAFDALRQHAQQASATIDLIGPHAHDSLAAATGAVGRFNGVLNSIHDKRIQVIADTATAIRSLERLQAMRIQDKSFTVYQRNQIIEQTVGPGGGIGRHNPGGSGGATGGSGGGASRGPVSVHVHLDESGRHTLSGYMQGHAQSVYDQNQRFAEAH